MTDDELKEFRKIATEATQGFWAFSGNYPFYVDVRKPAPSLSKHDDKRPTFWRYQDGVFVTAFCPERVLKLLDEIDRLKEIEFQYESCSK